MSEYNGLNSVLMDRIIKLAAKRNEPFIVIEDPRKVAYNLNPRQDAEYFNYIATIGNVNVGFNGFYPSDLIDLYAELKAGLSIQDDHAARMGALLDAKSP